MLHMELQNIVDQSLRLDIIGYVKALKTCSYGEGKEEHDGILAEIANHDRTKVMSIHFSERVKSPP